MPVVNVVLKSLEARRYQDPQARQQIRIDHNSHISLVQPDGERMRVEFGYTTSYGPLGVVKLEGTLWHQGEGVADAVVQWEKTRNLPTEVAQEVHAAIMSTCVPEAVGLAKSIRLPPPIPLPQIRFQKEGQTATAQQPGESPEIG